MIHCQSPAFFLSDCHLPIIPRAGLEEWTPRVVRFLRSEARRAATLFLVGDIFDFWFEWKHSIPARAFQVLAALHNLVREGVEVHYLAGNHDGHIGDFLRQEVGLKVTRKYIDAEIDSKKFHIIHGDGVARQDRGYRILRSLVRWGPTENIYRLVHPDFGIWFASKVSKVSRYKFSNTDKFGPDPYCEYAMKKLDLGFNYIIMGHRHTEEFTSHTNGAYLAIGGWIGKGSYGVFENGEARLDYFEAL